MKIIQMVLTFLRQRFCWHDWRYLKYHGLPNEPLLIECKKCKWITYQANLQMFD